MLFVHSRKIERMKIIKLYGERNTGTNYLSKLIDQNFEVNQLRGTVPRNKLLLLSEGSKDLYFNFTRKQNLGWKHSAVLMPLVEDFKDLHQCCFISLSKNPYSFLLSLYKRPYHYHGPMPASFSEFIRSPWKLRGRDHAPASKFENPIELWNFKNQSYLKLKSAFPEKTYNMTYESLLADYGAELLKIQAFFELKTISSDFANYSKSTKDANVSHKDYQKYYLNEEWRKDLKPEDVEYINSYLNKELLSAFDYKIVNPI